MLYLERPLQYWTYIQFYLVSNLLLLAIDLVQFHLFCTFLGVSHGKDTLTPMALVKTQVNIQPWP